MGTTYIREDSIWMPSRSSGVRNSIGLQLYKKRNSVSSLRSFQFFGVPAGFVTLFIVFVLDTCK